MADEEIESGGIRSGGTESGEIEGRGKATPEEMLSDEERTLKQNSSLYTEEEILTFQKEVVFGRQGNVRYSEHLRLLLIEKPELMKELLPHLAGRPLIDLGCGQVTLGFADSYGRKEYSNGKIPPVLEIAKQAGIPSYTGVDLHHHFRGLEVATWRRVAEALGFPVSFKYDDMLHFLHSLSDTSSNITINGIDRDIITSAEGEWPGKDLSNTNWYKAFVQELGRVVPEGGVIFGNNADFLESKDLELIGLHALNSDVDDLYQTYIYLKG